MSSQYVDLPVEGSGSATVDGFTYLSGTSAIYLGQGSAPVISPQSLSMQLTPASGSNITGSNLTIAPGNGTGTGGSGSINFQTAPVAGSSSTPNTPVTVLSVSNTGSVALGATSTTPQHVVNTAAATPGSGVGTITNLPAGYSGNPTGYIQITINGGTHVIPYW